MKITLKYGGNSIDWEAIVELNEVIENELSCIDANENLIVLREFTNHQAAVDARIKLIDLVSKAVEGGVVIEIIIDDL